MRRTVSQNLRAFHAPVKRKYGSSSIGRASGLKSQKFERTIRKALERIRNSEYALWKPVMIKQREDFMAALSLISLKIQKTSGVCGGRACVGNTRIPAMPRRMAGYIGRAIEHHGLPIYSNVIYLRPNAGTTDPGHYIQEHLGYEIVIRYRVIRLIEIEGQRVLESGQSGLIPFTPLMKPPEGVASDAWLRQCIHTARTHRIARSPKADYLAGMVALSELVYDPETVSDIIFKEGIMDILRESSLIQYFKQEGIEQGIEQGGRQRAIEDLLEVLEIRFDMSEAHPLSTRIAAIDDLQHLKQLLRAAVQVPNLEAFQRVLDA